MQAAAVRFNRVIDTTLTTTWGRAIRQSGWTIEGLECPARLVQCGVQNMKHKNGSSTVSEI